ncbi:TPA: hypothetical protein DEB72_02425, partial [Patescibacteria group bacterium]|nr:hypothetical protein [Patescibacteria group bacterium]
MWAGEGARRLGSIPSAPSNKILVRGFGCVLTPPARPAFGAAPPSGGPRAAGHPDHSTRYAR